jgi:hypothetical protein
MVATTWRHNILARTLLLLCSGASLAVADAPGACREGADVAVWTSPRAPVAGGPLGVLAVADTESASELAIADPAGKAVALTTVRLGGPPWSLGGTIASARAGTYRIVVRRGGEVVACHMVAVGNGDLRSGRTLGESNLAWDRRTEAFYSAWIERLFDAPPSEALGFPALQDALRDASRNFLHDHLQLGEDDAGSRSALTGTPDCADLPYFLRAYFAWKIGLPFGVRACSRGTASSPPRCGDPKVTERPGQGVDPLASFKVYARELMDTVHSGSARTALDDNATDFYPVKLARDVLRPGVIYADPYGHTLLIVKWVPQTPEHGGLLLAVDAQPDNSVGRKRFWEGTFLFTSDTRSAGPGFKAFRPLVRNSEGRLRPLTNDALVDDVRFVPFSDEQAHWSSEEFYARMSGLINPQGLDPVRAYEETLDALVEQLQTRVGSVDNGERYMRAHPSPAVVMPDGAHIFETTGPWEDYATPSRDMRLIIAMNVLAGLPDRIVRHPELYVLGSERAEEARARVEALHARLVRERTIVYRRSDGSPWTLTVADILARKAAFEMAYNPNDCVEIRWGAAEGTEEYAPCRRHAPAEQRARMAEYRPWFREARRPPR